MATRIRLVGGNSWPRSTSARHRPRIGLRKKAWRAASWRCPWWSDLVVFRHPSEKWWSSSVGFILTNIYILYYICYIIYILYHILYIIYIILYIIYYIIYIIYYMYYILYIYIYYIILYIYICKNEIHVPNHQAVIQWSYFTFMGFNPNIFGDLITVIYL